MCLVGVCRRTGIANAVWMPRASRNRKPLVLSGIPGHTIYMYVCALAQRKKKKKKEETEKIALNNLASHAWQPPVAGNNATVSVNPALGYLFLFLSAPRGLTVRNLGAKFVPRRRSTEYMHTNAS